MCFLLWLRLSLILLSAYLAVCGANDKGLKDIIYVYWRILPSLPSYLNSHHKDIPLFPIILILLRVIPFIFSGASAPLSLSVITGLVEDEKI